MPHDETWSVVEHKTFNLKPSTLRPYFELYRSIGRSIQEHHLGTMLGYYVVDVGPQNQVISLWKFTDALDRQRRRGALVADPAWRDYALKVKPFIDSMHIKLLRVAPLA